VPHSGKAHVVDIASPSGYLLEPLFARHGRAHDSVLIDIRQSFLKESSREGAG